jgi:hypothetical protein
MTHPCIFVLSCLLFARSFASRSCYLAQDAPLRRPYRESSPVEIPPPLHIEPRDVAPPPAPAPAPKQKPAAQDPDAAAEQRRKAQADREQTLLRHAGQNTTEAAVHQLGDKITELQVILTNVQRQQRTGLDELQELKALVRRTQDASAIKIPKDLVVCRFRSTILTCLPCCVYEAKNISRNRSSSSTEQIPQPRHV